MSDPHRSKKQGVPSLILKKCTPLGRPIVLESPWDGGTITRSLYYSVQLSTSEGQEQKCPKVSLNRTVAPPTTQSNVLRRARGEEGRRRRRPRGDGRKVYAEDGDQVLPAADEGAHEEEHAAAEDALKWAARTYLVAAIGALASLLYWAFQILGSD